MIILRGTAESNCLHLHAAAVAQIQEKQTTESHRVKCLADCWVSPRGDWQKQEDAERGKQEGSLHSHTLCAK